MGFPARYFVLQGVPDAAVVGGIETVVDRVYSTDNVPHGYVGMDSYYAFAKGSLMGQVMFKQGPEGLGVVVFAMPSLMQKGKARDLLTAIVHAVPGAQPQSFPGSGGLLSFST